MSPYCTLLLPSLYFIWIYILFLFQSPTQEPTLLIISPSASLDYDSFSDFLAVDDLVLSTGQVFYRIFLNIGLAEVFLIIRLKLWALGRELKGTGSVECPKLKMSQKNHLAP